MRNRADIDARRGGYVLVSVLAVVALLSGLVAALLLLSRSAADTVGLESRDLRREVLVRSAITLAGYELFVLKRPEAAVTGRQLRLDGGLVSLTVATEAGKADLNGSGKALLEAAYRASGLKTLDPKAFAARVIDWRDADDDAGPDGAEAPAYRGLAPAPRNGPRNGPFRGFDDLGFVLGVGPGDLNRLRPFLTVFNAPGRLSAFHAPQALIAALPGVAAATVKEVVGLRAERTVASAEKLADLLLVQAALIDTARPRTYRVGIEIRTATGGRSHGVSVVLSAGATVDRPFQVLAWDDAR